MIFMKEGTFMQEERFMKDKLRKQKTAVALEYNPSENAPKIVASGKGFLAEKIIERAKEAEVPIHKDDRLAQSLSKLNIDDYIPKELYQAVAEVLLFVDRLDRIKAKEVDDRH